MNPLAGQAPAPGAAPAEPMGGDPTCRDLRFDRATLGRVLRDPEFVRGLREMGGMSLGVGAWGLVTGVAMVKVGLNAYLATLMTLLVYAGSAQLVVVPLMVAGSPLWVVLLTAICVNLRFVIFSTMWRHYFGQLPRRWRAVLGYFSGDVIFVNFMRRFPVERPAPGQFAYFWGAAAANWTSWQLMSLLGILLTNVIPEHWGLGFAGTLALAGVLCSMLSDRITTTAAVVSGAAAVAAFALPFKLNILVAIAAAVAVGLVLEAMAPPPSRVVSHRDAGDGA